MLRFLGRRIPRDYNKLPALLYWSLHLVWLFPWSLFAPATLILAWRNRRKLLTLSSPPGAWPALFPLLFSATVLLFFSLSTNQEYYTFPAYLPLLLLTSIGLVSAERSFLTDRTLRRALLSSHAAFTLLGAAVAAALAAGLFSARHVAATADIGTLLARRGIGSYTLSMSHFLDLTGPSFAALRLPAALALVTLAVGPGIAWWLRRRHAHIASTTSIALTSAAFLIAAHLALIRFAPLLSSQDFAARIQALQAAHAIEPGTRILLFGDQSFGSSIPFYLGRQVLLVDGRSSSMLFGSSFPDAPPLFLTPQDLAAQWGRGPRKLLFVPAERRADAEQLLGTHTLLIAQTSGKLLLTDRPLAPAARTLPAAH